MYRELRDCYGVPKLHYRGVHGDFYVMVRSQLWVVGLRLLPKPAVFNSCAIEARCWHSRAQRFHVILNWIGSDCIGS